MTSSTPGAESVVDLLLVGAGGTCADVLAIIESLNAEAMRFNCIGLLDDDVSLHGGHRHGLPVLGPLAAAKGLSGMLVDCLGSPASYGPREALLRDRGLAIERFQTLVAPTACVASTCRIGSGCIVYPGVVLMADVCLGAHVTILANTVLNHEVEVGDFTILTSGVNVSGRVRIGRACYVGAGSSLIQNVTVGDGAMVGLGSAVIRDVPAGGVVAGNPAKPIRQRRA